MRSPLPRFGLYAITRDPEYSPTALTADAESALRGGAVILQYRRKAVAPERALEEARGLTTLCNRYGALLIVNDTPSIAQEAGAHGVHLGRDDGDIARILATPNRRLLVGVSCYDSLSRAREMAAAGVDYLAFGSVFASSTKPRAVRCPLSVITSAKAELGLPVVAIGGITPENAGPVIAAGADFLAVIGGVFEQPDIENSAARYARLFGNAKVSPHV